MQLLCRSSKRGFLGHVLVTMELSNPMKKAPLSNEEQQLKSRWGLIKDISPEITSIYKIEENHYENVPNPKYRWWKPWVKREVKQLKKEYADKKYTWRMQI